MYKAPPPRPKKTDIVRSRSRCRGCRQRRVKCDEQKPSCRACVRRGVSCEAVMPSLDFHNVTVSAHESPGSRHCQRLRFKHSQGPPKVEQSHLAEDSRVASSVSPPLLAASPSPSPARSEHETMYLAHWNEACVHALQYSLRQISLTTDRNAPFKAALLALSACNLSRSLPERDEQDAQVAYRPNPRHLLSSQQYYITAVGQAAKTILRSSLMAPSHTLAMLVLFCNIETAMSNFTGFDCHAQGIINFIQTHFQEITSDALGRGAIATWVLARNHNWWLRMNFSSASFQLAQSSLSLPMDISNVLHSIGSRRATVTSILCETYRLRTIAFLQSALEDAIAAPGIDDCVALMQAESAKLDYWHSTLSQSELPFGSFTEFNPHDNSQLRPLFFTSHRLAMNYAYYVSSRVLQSMPHPGATKTEGSMGDAEIAHWSTTLLRIVSGLDKKDCARKNVYSIGVSSLLVACVLRYHSLVFGRWVEKWLLECHQLSIFEEGSFPIAQAWQVVRLVNEERAAGNYACAIALPEDDGGGVGKYTSYSSQRFDRVLLLRREGGSPRLPWEFVSVNMVEQPSSPLDGTPDV
ncbi:hypothetical protein ASPVEDRAFT_56299 [Aspergillus versicolor CBS 583.65]|uniref:Zn(2)-C6 fungal-type domain-containing protein n=1 Tax=Aspergillus versicolor CBS 583.65 TaxID=1036611 RepID=A0A1L9PZ65_ASPVE|nr:uncharacterized protein ASPVEDRAFT_56299 [Aspergillus versicolor CBS 583.65]OJJ06755.1 hypothetical protein ASPVEDRAFT_56299 [Aspergillus versicolor CBS 583.65]